MRGRICGRVSLSHTGLYSGEEKLTMIADMVAAEERRLNAKKPAKKAKKDTPARAEEDVKVSKDVKVEENKAAEEATPAAS